MKIGIYGGAFDPFHNGHLSMIRGAIASKKVDRVIVIPTGMPCFKPARKMTLSPYRFYMTKAALKDEPKCEVCDIEQVFGEPSYTVTTLRNLRSKKIVSDKDELYLMCGSDILFEFESWYQPDKILEQAKLLCALRPGIDEGQAKNQAEHIEEVFDTKVKFFHIDGVEVASSRLRAAADDDWSDEEAVPEAVRTFIKCHGLYCEDAPLMHVSDETYTLLMRHCFTLFHEMSGKRLLHSMNVCVLSARLAIRFGADPDKCALAGLLHDCAKELPEQQQIDLAAKIIHGYIPGKQILHSPAGAVYAKEHYGIEDQEILDAIQFHTIGREIMTTTDKIVYLADKIEPGRDFDDLTMIRRYAEYDLNAALIECYCAIKESFAKKGQQIHEDTKKSLAYLLANRSQ
ncbi:MAG: nicotinate (nicotinamide) nucleotide adenylyltransferase [Clostridiales bacterium]|nr:nicotinate (nicotinamide) nucleotide adenylyltransferase [Clostridiales bacterium]